MWDIKWVKDKEILDLENKKYVGGSLVDDFFIIKLFIEKDEGIYLCIVINVVGFVLNIVIIGNIFLLICLYVYLYLVFIIIKLVYILLLICYNNFYKVYL